MTAKSKPKFTITKTISPTPMAQAEFEALEDLLARLVARAIAIDLHPEWFGMEVKS